MMAGAVRGQELRSLLPWPCHSHTSFHGLETGMFSVIFMWLEQKFCNS